MGLLSKNWALLSGLILLFAIFWLSRGIALLGLTEETQILYQQQMNKCLQDFQIPCRWVPDMGGGFGYPLFNYFPPLPFYFGAIIYLLSNNFELSVRAGQIWQIVILPLGFLSINMLSKKVKLRSILMFALSLSVLILSADLIISSSLISLWVLFKYFQSKSSTFLLACFISVILTLMLSAFFILPSAVESNLVHKVDNFEYLPKSAKEKPKNETHLKYQTLIGDSDITHFKQGSNWLKFETNTRTHTIIRLSLFYFPNWKIFVDGKEIVIDYQNNSLGLMNLILGEGVHTIEARLYDTHIRSLSNLITIFGVTLIIFLFSLSFVRVRKWILYYRRRID